MNKQTAWSWEETRRIGRFNYVFRYGVLRLGLWFVVARIIHDALQGRLASSPTRWLQYLGIVITALMLVFGTLMGLWMWSNNERRYRKSQSNPANAPVG